MKKLENMLMSIDHKGYPAYKSLKGTYQFSKHQLIIEHVQGDPFAAPSRVSIRVRSDINGFPREYLDRKNRRIALEDYVLRLFSREVSKYTFKAKGSGKSGCLSVCGCGPEILQRSACHIDESSGDLMVRFSVGFPANGRSINAGELKKIFFDYVPEIVLKSCVYSNINKAVLKKHVDYSDDRVTMEEQIKEMGLVAFVANGSVLPRESGISKRPMKDAVKFTSPADMEVTMHLPHAGDIKGMGIPCGVTLIVGGGYHGKSTLMQTLENAIYPHIPGDGREYTVIDETAVKLRAEDGRSVKNKDISMFIRNLPDGRETADFSTADASGSTSQAAGLVEALEAGSRALLIDEDTSATNFMMRDELMEKVISAGQEPIVPFIRHMRPLYTQKGVSVILVAGSIGTFFHVSDKIIQMKNYIPVDITSMAKKAAKDYPPGFDADKKEEFYDTEKPYKFVAPAAKEKRNYRTGERIESRQHGKVSGSKIKINGTDGFSLNKENIDMRHIEQIADPEQMMGIAKVMDAILTKYDGRSEKLSKVMDACMHDMERNGFDGIPGGAGLADMAMPKKYQIMAAFNRYRR